MDVHSTACVTSNGHAADHTTTIFWPPPWMWIHVGIPEAPLSSSSYLRKIFLCLDMEIWHPENASCPRNGWAAICFVMMLERLSAPFNQKGAIIPAVIASWTTWKEMATCCFFKVAFGSEAFWITLKLSLNTFIRALPFEGIGMPK